MPPEWVIDGRFSGPGDVPLASRRHNSFRSLTGVRASEQSAGGALPSVVHGLDAGLADGNSAACAAITPLQTLLDLDPVLNSRMRSATNP